MDIDDVVTRLAQHELECKLRYERIEEILEEQKAGIKSSYIAPMALNFFSKVFLAVCSAFMAEALPCNIDVVSLANIIFKSLIFLFFSLVCLLSLMLIR